MTRWLEVLVSWGLSGLLLLVSGYSECPVQDYESACGIGGNLTVTTSSGHVISPTTCDVYLAKQNFTYQPSVTYDDAKPGETYTLVFVDRDAFRNSYFLRGYYYLYWILANIPGADFKEGTLTSGTVISSYRAAAPEPNTGEHRLMFIVYKHVYPESRISTPVPDTLRNRFKLSTWLYQYREVLSCVPLAGTQARTHSS